MNAITPATIDTPILSQVSEAHIALICAQKFRWTASARLKRRRRLSAGSRAANARSRPARCSISRAVAPPIEAHERSGRACTNSASIETGDLHRAPAPHGPRESRKFRSPYGADRRGIFGHLACRSRRATVLCQTRAVEAQGRRALGGAGQAQRGGGGVHAGRRALAAARRPARARRGREGRMVRDGLPCARRPSALEGPASCRHRGRGFRRRGRA